LFWFDIKILRLTAFGRTAQNAQQYAPPPPAAAASDCRQWLQHGCVASRRQLPIRRSALDPTHSRGFFRPGASFSTSFPKIFGPPRLAARRRSRSQ
jgi:hypothetical protein